MLNAYSDTYNEFIKLELKKWFLSFVVQPHEHGKIIYVRKFRFHQRFFFLTDDSLWVLSENPFGKRIKW